MIGLLLMAVKAKAEAKHKKKKSKKKHLKAKTILAMWALAVKTRDGFKCVYCGRTSEQVDLESHHIFSRRHAAIKYNMDDGLTFCVREHTQIISSYELKKWIIDYIGQEKYDELEKMSYKVKIWTESEKREIYESLKKYIKSSQEMDRGGEGRN